VKPKREIGFHAIGKEVADDTRTMSKRKRLKNWQPERVKSEMIGDKATQTVPDCAKWKKKFANGRNFKK
jgi:hypothetical protein